MQLMVILMCCSTLRCFSSKGLRTSNKVIEIAGMHRLRWHYQEVKSEVARSRVTVLACHNGIRNKWVMCPSDPMDHTSCDSIRGIKAATLQSSMVLRVVTVSWVFVNAVVIDLAQRPLRWVSSRCLSYV